MKKKIFAIALAASIAVLAIAGTSMAYFTDVDEATNVFTTGKVDIQITEAQVKADAKNEHIVKVDPEVRVASTGLNYKEIRTLWPGQSVAKDPRIENIGSEDAFVGAIITISGIQALLTTDEARAAFIKGGAVNDANNTVDWVVEGDDLKIYVVVAKQLDRKSGDTVKSVDLFTSINIDPNWDNDDMAKLANLEIKVNAYATQTAGFDSASDALLAAFPTEWEILKP